MGKLTSMAMQEGGMAAAEAAEKHVTTAEAGRLLRSRAARASIERIASKHAYIRHHALHERSSA
jgi:hypothetical protein